MSKLKVLIVEDEVLIADTLQRYLNAFGHQVVGKAMCYQEAIEMYRQEQPDITLLDIRLSGTKTGVDVANFIQQQTHSTPFVYLSSQLDRRSLDRAKATFPAGYLTKPIERNSLYTTIEMATHKTTPSPSSAVYQFQNGKDYYKVNIDDILFLEAEHVYVRIHRRSASSIVQRISLRDLLVQLPAARFLQTHRSFAINIGAGFSWNTSKSLQFETHEVPVSRACRKAVNRLFGG